MSYEEAIPSVGSFFVVAIAYELFTYFFVPNQKVLSQCKTEAQRRQPGSPTSPNFSLGTGRGSDRLWPLSWPQEYACPIL
jgi:hypothetical protein